MQLKTGDAVGAVVGEHLADQLMPPMVIGEGGAFQTLKPSLHAKTNRDVIEFFNHKHFKFEELAKNCGEIRM